MSYRGLLLGAGASLLGVAMLLLEWLAGPVDLDLPGVGVSSDEGKYTIAALALIVAGATTAVASLIASRDDPDRPPWVTALSGVLVILAVVAVALTVLAITSVVLLCRDGCG